MGKILLVDDNAELLEMLAFVLGGADHSVITASDGKEAIHLARNNDLDLVITDLLMPEREGIETIMELQREFPALKIIAMSGGGVVAAEEYLGIARKLGVAMTLTKPFSGQALLEAANSLLQE